MFKKLINYLLVLLFLLMVFAMMVGAFIGATWYLATKISPKYLGLVLVIVGELLLLNWFSLLNFVVFLAFLEVVITTLFLLYLQDKFEESDEESDTLDIRFELTDKIPEGASRIEKFVRQWSFFSVLLHSGWWVFEFATFPFVGIEAFQLSVFAIFTTMGFSMMVIRISGGRKSKFWKSLKELFTFRTFRLLPDTVRSK